MLRERWSVVAAVLPGVLLLLVALGLHRAAGRDSPPAAPAVDQIPAPLALPLGPTPAPPVRFLIDRAADLKLSAGQLERLRRLDRDWQRDGAALQQQAERRSKALEQALVDSAGGNGNDVQQAAAELADVSGRLGAVRRSYWDKARMILTNEQYEQARALRRWARSGASGG